MPNLLDINVPKLEYVPAILAGTMVFGLYAILTVMLFYTIPKDNLQTINLVLGAITGSVGTIIAFYFGSSKSAQVKDLTISEIAKTATIADTGGGTGVGNKKDSLHEGDEIEGTIEGTVVKKS